MEHKKEYSPRTEKSKRIVQLLPVLNDIKIAIEAGCTKENVRQIRNKVGIKSPIKGERCSIFINEDKLTEILIRLRNPKISLREICDNLNADYQSVRRIFKKYEYDVKSRYKIKITDDEILKTLSFCNNKISEAGRILGVSTMTLYKRLHKIEERRTHENTL